MTSAFDSSDPPLDSLLGACPGLRTEPLADSGLPVEPLTDLVLARGSGVLLFAAAMLRDGLGLFAFEVEPLLTWFGVGVFGGGMADGVSYRRRSEAMRSSVRYAVSV